MVIKMTPFADDVPNQIRRNSHAMFDCWKVNEVPMSPFLLAKIPDPSRYVNSGARIYWHRTRERETDRQHSLLSSNVLMSSWWFTEVNKGVVTPIVIMTGPTLLSLLLLTLLRLGPESTY